MLVLHSLLKKTMIRDSSSVGEIRLENAIKYISALSYVMHPT